MYIKQTLEMIWDLKADDTLLYGRKDCVFKYYFVIVNSISNLSVNENYMKKQDASCIQCKINLNKSNKSIRGE